MLNIFINREKYTNNVPELDELLDSSFKMMLYQESIMAYLVWLGIEESETYDIIKKIAKKKFKQEELDELETKLKQNWFNKLGNYNFFKETWQVVNDASKYSFNASHSLSYAYDSLYGSYLKSHYPLEYYSVILKNYEGDLDRTNKIYNELIYFKIALSSPKFRYSSNDYTIDKETNTIFKGVSSIKGISKNVGEQLSQLKGNAYNSFFELLKDLKPNSIHLSDILILTKLDYFSEFGKIKSLLKYIEIFQQFYGAKTFKKDKKYLVKIETIKKFCEKETTKQHSDFKENEFLEYIWLKLPQKDLDIKEKVKYQLEYFGYIDIIDQEQDSKLWIVTSLEPRGTNYIAKLYNIYSGKQEQCKIRKRIYQDNQIQKSDFILLRGFSSEGIRYKNGDNWEQSTESFENILKEYRKI